ncbi:MAG TPA: hypothetical protein VIK54_03125 [Acidimicrobiia bacterium]
MEPAPPRSIVIACDVSRLVDPDGPALDALARLRLTAHRLGVTIELHNACPVLVDLIALAGLTDVLVVADSGIEVDRQVEEREQVRVDEEVLRGDESP